MLDHLGRRRQILAGGGHALPARQRTLRETLADRRLHEEGVRATIAEAGRLIGLSDSGETSVLRAGLVVASGPALVLRGRYACSVVSSPVP